jgi:arylsulfatase A
MKQFCCLLAALCAFAIFADDRPNIVVVLCDDLGYGDLACYGHPHIKTPHLNQMAKDGIRFTDFYSTAPVCSPSRVGLLTGRSPNRAGVYDWIPPAGPNAKRPDARHKVHMRKDEVTIAQLLKKSGYATCMSGKWHCNAMFNSPHQAQPNDAGFDHWFGTQNNASPSHANPKNYVRNGKPVGPLKGYSCQLVIDEALDWLGERVQAKDDKPFFMYLAFHEPHEPVASPPELVKGYADVAKTQNEAQYFANVENVDLAVGKLLKGLKAHGVDDNTLVVFTADNGPETLKRYGGAGRSYGVATPLRGMKLWTTDAGFRVNGIMRWPARIKAGQTVKHPVSALDFLPTFCELAKTKPPDDLALDGASFLPALDNKPIAREKPLVWAYYNAINQERVAMRDGDWKVLAKIDSGKMGKFTNLHSGNVAKVKAAKLTDIEIYKISDDINESKNLAKSHPEKLAELQKRLETHYAELLENSHVWESR